MNKNSCRLRKDRRVCPHERGGGGRREKMSRAGGKGGRGFRFRGLALELL